MNTFVVVNVFAIALLQMVSSASFGAQVSGHGPFGGPGAFGARPRPTGNPPSPPSLPPKPDEDERPHVTWAPDALKQFTGHDGPHPERNDTDGSREEEHGKGRVTFVPRKDGVTWGPFDGELVTGKDHRGSFGFFGGFRRHKRHNDERSNGGQEGRRNTVTEVPRRHGTESGVDASDEGVTRNPADHHDLVTEQRGDRHAQPPRRPKREARGGHDKPRPEQVTEVPRRHGTESGVDASDEGVTRNPADHHDLVTEQRGDRHAQPPRRPKREARGGHDKPRPEQVTEVPRRHGTESGVDASDEGVTRNPADHHDLVTEQRGDRHAQPPRRPKREARGGHDKPRPEQVTEVPRRHGTESGVDASDEGVTRNPVDHHDLVTEQRGGRGERNKPGHH